MKALLKFRFNQENNDCRSLICLISIILFCLQIIYWIFFYNPLLGNNTSPNFSYNFLLFENVSREYNITNNSVKIVSDNETFYLNKLKNYLTNFEKIKNVEIYNNSKELYELLKKSYHLSNLTIQLDIKKKDSIEEINFLFKIWELKKRKIKKSSNDFYITINYDDKIKSLEKIKKFIKYQKIITNFITFMNNNSNINYPKLNVAVESSQFINVPNEKLYKTKDKNQSWIILFSFWMILMIVWDYLSMFNERDSNFIGLLYRYGIKAYQNIISLFIYYSYCLYFFCIFEFLIFEKIYFDLSYFSIILCFIAIFFFIIQHFFFILFLYHLFRNKDVSGYCLLVMLLINIIFFISNGFHFFTSNINFFIMMMPNIWLIMILLNIMKINYFQTFSWDLLKMYDFEEFTYFQYIKYSIIPTIIYIVLTIITYYIYEKISIFNCFKNNILFENNNLINEKDNNKIYDEKLNQEEEYYKSQNNYLSIKGLTKQYEDIIAINNLSFDFFPNEIFCLIGHNGAGKTTLIKMIAGLEEPNKGKILLGNNNSLIKNKKVLYENIGICEQDNILLYHRTISQYIDFLLKIKGEYENEKKISNLLNELNLDDNNISKLSNDEKKKLSIIIAFLGNNKIILLDEPTSQVSRETRDLICNFLKKNKEEKIIIFTTHSLEEAEFLADKIGIIKNGEIICSGTTSYIKNMYCNSFNLNLIFDSKINEESKNQLIEGLNDYCNKKCRVKIFTDSLLQLNISYADFHDFFEYLDNQAKQQFNITNYSISTTTLEDIFIFLNEEEKQDKGNNDNVEILNFQTPNKNMNDNIMIKQNLFNNLCLNIKKNIKYLGDFNSIIYQLLHLFLILILFFEAKENFIDNEDFINLEELIRKAEITIYTNNISYINNSYYFNNIKKNIKFNNNTNFESISDFASFIKNNSKLMNERSAILFKKENENITIYNLYQGSAPDYFQATMNLLINIISETEFNLIINSGKEYGDLNIFIYTNDENLYIYCFVIEIIIIFITNISQVLFKEKENNIKHLLYLNGNSELNYWIGIFMRDIFRLIIYIIIIIIFFYIEEFNFSVLIDIILCLVASCLFIYCISLFYSQTDIILFYIYVHLFIAIMIFLSYCMILVYSLNLNQSFKETIELLKIGNYIFTISDLCPLTSLTTLFIRLLINDNSIDNEKSKNENLIFIYIIILGIQIIFYGALFYLMEIKKYKIKLKKNENINITSNNSLNEEYNKKDINLCNSVLSNYNNLTEYFIPKDISLNIINLTYNIFEKNKLICKKKIKKQIINNLNLELKVNEKLGLLGKSGTGKSLILKSIIQEKEYSGEIYLLGQNIKENFNILRKDIGYCPQENILIDEIKVIDFLNFYKELKINSDLKNDLNYLINLLGLKQYLNRKCNSLSEGNKRKLSFIISILYKPKLLLLDNPTVGIDTKTRKIIWRYLKQLNDKYNMILISNDIEEIEYLCDKVSILKDGNLQFNDNIEQLKIAHSIGYIFTINFKKENINYENIDDLFENLKNKIKYLDNLGDNFKKDYECLNKLNQIIDYLLNNYSEIEFNNSDYDKFSLQFIIKIDDNKKGKLFSLILNLKNQFDFILDICIQNESLEKILPNI